jgi:cytochrome c553
MTSCSFSVGAMHDLQGRRNALMWLGLVALVWALGSLVWSAAGVADEAKLKALGRHLAQDCTSCHQPDGRGGGAFPSITGWEVDSFVRTLKLYQDGARTNPVMVSVARSLDEEQVRALALYWASQPKPARK